MKLSRKCNVNSAVVVASIFSNRSAVMRFIPVLIMHESNILLDKTGNADYMRYILLYTYAH